MRFFCLSLALALAGAASAATIPRMTLERVVSSSPRAVHGVVTRTWSAWDEARAAIWTHYEIRVTETLRGPARASLTISEPGGVVDGIGMAVPGAPRFAVGEEAVIFAYPTPIGYWRVRGFGQGLFRVDARGGRRVVRGMPSEGLLLGRKSSDAKASFEAAEQGLDVFLDRVRAMIGEGEAQ